MAMKRPDTLIDVAKASEDAWTHGLAMAGFLDNFYTLPDRRQAMIDPEPPLIGKAEMDAYLGAVAEHLARRWNLTILPWTDDPARFLKKPKFASSIEALKPLLLAQRPLAFCKRIIFVEHKPLTRARMPHS